MGRLRGFAVSLESLFKKRFRSKRVWSKKNNQVPAAFLLMCLCVWLRAAGYQPECSRLRRLGARQAGLVFSQR